MWHLVDIHCLGGNHLQCIVKAGLYRIGCGVHTLGDNGVHTLGDTSVFVNPAGQLLLTRRVNSWMDSVGKVFELYIAGLSHVPYNKKYAFFQWPDGAIGFGMSENIVEKYTLFVFLC